MSTMRLSVLMLCVVGCCVVSHSSLLVGVEADTNGVLSSAILTGSYFSIPDINRTSNEADNRPILLVTNQTNGVLLNSPELQVVANTTIYFNLSAIWPFGGESVSFGLTLSGAPRPLAAPVNADPLGLAPTAASLAAGSCTTLSTTAQRYDSNSWGLNFTGTYPNQVFSTTPCVVQWLVPPYDPSVNATQYYYFDAYAPTTPRRIHIVGPASPTTPSPSGSGTGSGGNNNNTTSPPTSPPTTPAPSGTSSLSPTSPSSSSSTGSKVPSAAFPSGHVSAWTAVVLVLATGSAAAAAASC